MPELPEVETVRRGLAPVMEGKKVTRLELRRPDLRYPFPEGFARRVVSAKVTSLSRRGKYLLAALDNELVVIMHLGMSGSFRIESGALDNSPGSFRFPRSPDARHDHVTFHLRGEDGEWRIVYNDPRRFGFMDMSESGRLSENRHLARLGLDPLGNEMSAAALAECLAGKESPLKSALLDQRVIAGLGNIYVSEALWQARLSPFRKAASIVRGNGTPGTGCGRLVEAIRNVLGRAIAAGGSSLRDHRRADGELGYFQHELNVYGRTAVPCGRGGCDGRIQRRLQGGRSTFWCARCQR
jgi:formamidopyrimidine-DNA glycosylase